jgi:serine/threonine-protein kinase
MEWLRGETLYDRLWRRGALPLPQALPILLQVCDALSAAHARQVVHRDLKPANVFLCASRDGRVRVKLLDFGIAQLGRARAPSLAEECGVVGTPEYASPEQASGAPLDGRSDLYSLGVMAYEMVLGRQPFLSVSAADAFHLHLTARPPRPSILWPAIPPSLEALLLRLLAKDPAERPSLAALRNELEKLRAQLLPAPLPSRRRVWRVGVVAGALVAMALLLGRPVLLRAQQARKIVSIPPIQSVDAGVP